MRVTGLLALLALSAGLSARQSSYLQTGDDWIRFDGEHAYLVDPEVVTVRTISPVDVQYVLDGLTGPLAGAELVRSNRLGFHDVRIPTGRDVLEFVNTLRSEGCFALVEENTFGIYVGGTPGDPMFASQWNLDNNGQSGGSTGADVGALSAWQIQDGSPDVTVAVIDSGTEWSHEDLSGNIWTNIGETIDGTDTDGNGYVDDIRGWNYEFQTNDPACTFFHGTAVASVVASQGNAVGLVGLAGGALDGEGVKIMALQVGSFFPLGSELDDAILYALDNGADIVTLSLSVGQAAAIDAAIADAYSGGVFIDCAAGNNGFSVTYPATLAEVMAVASTNDLDQVSSFSNPGPEVEVAAPGEDIPMADLGGGYTSSSGTSFASPHVAALAALLLSQDASLTNVELRQIIADTAEDIGSVGADNQSGAGRIDANAALMATMMGSLTVYGAGTVGTGGVAPAISASNVPVVSRPITINTTMARPNAPAVLLFSAAEASLPFLGGTILVDPSGLQTFGAGTNGAGDAARTFMIPDNPAFAGAERFAQWLVLDPAAPMGLSMSPGLALVVGSN